jgi:nucleoside-diphosphate-sugar epimerase
MDIFILGGTGFLGYHAIKELLRRGHTIRTLSLPPAPPEGLLPPEVSIYYGDFNTLSDDAIRAMMDGCQGVIFAAGADDSVTPKKPAYPFFYRANVLAGERFFRLAKEAGVTRGVLLGSYFSHFDRIWPEMALTKHHPYIRSRVEQEAAVFKAAGSELDVMILELPYIFGDMPGRIPLWKPIIDYLLWPIPWVFFPKGGTAMVGVDHVAEAIAGALEQGESGVCYQIADENMTWDAWLHRLSRLAGRQKKVVTLPNWIIKPGLIGVSLWHQVNGLEGGLDPTQFIELQTRETFIDPEPAQKALGFSGGGLDGALKDTIKGCGYRLE